MTSSRHSAATTSRMAGCCRVTWPPRRSASRGEATSTWVNAGQVPLRLRAPETGAAATMGPGETATVEITRTDAQGRPLVPVATPEWKRPSLASVYALTKYVQERLTMTVTAAYGMEGVALRLFNVYGPGQALSNPYTGVLAIFASRLLNGNSPLLFEDGPQRRDFVHVDDVAGANAASIAATAELPAETFRAYNVGSGVVHTIGDMAAAIAGPDGPQPVVTGEYRLGDVRHVTASSARIRSELGWQAQVDFEQGMRDFATAPLRAAVQR